MANQIAANFSYLSTDEAAEATAAHLKSFWPPEMRHEFCAEVSDDELVTVARAAKVMLTQGQ